MPPETNQAVALKPRILVIDDNPAIHGDFQKILCPDDAPSAVAAYDVSLFGDAQAPTIDTMFEMDSAYQGQEGCAKVEQALAEKRPYSMAFVDGRMPPGWDGLETIVHLWKAYPELQVLSCHDEYLLPTMFDVDGLLVGYGNIAPELLVELIEAGKAQDYPRAHAIHERLLPVTKNVYHRGSHMEGTVALKWGLVNRGILDHATVRTPLLPDSSSVAPVTYRKGNESAIGDALAMFPASVPAFLIAW